MEQEPSCAQPLANVDYGGAKADERDGNAQPFPSSGQLAPTLNCGPDTLRARLGTRTERTYCYVVASMRVEDGRFVQGGSGPNFQGDLITLCTCKHQMRSRLDPPAWVGRWVAGFSGRGAVGDGKRYLVYLTRVAAAYESHADLWRALGEASRRAKAAEAHRLGDLFRPKDVPGDPFDPQSYVGPRPDHAHAGGNGWYGDVAYRGRSGRRPALLVGDPEHSYLWDSPLIPAPFRLPRDYTVKPLARLLEPDAAGVPR